MDLKHFVRVGLSIALSTLIVVAPIAQAQPMNPPQKPVKVGLLLPLSGVFTVIATEVKRGYDLYMDLHGKEAGRAIQTVVENDELRAQVALLKFRKLVEQDRINVLAGLFDATVAEALRLPVQDAKLPTLVVTGPQRDLMLHKNPYLFRLSFSNAEYGQSVGRWIQENGFKRLMIISPEYTSAVEMVDSLVSTLKPGSIEIVSRIQTKMGEPDFSPYFAQVRSIKPDVVYGWAAGADAIRFVQQWKTFGLDKVAQLVGPSGLTDDSLLAQQGDAALGIVTNSYYTPSLQAPSNTEFVKAYRAKYEGKPPGGFTVVGWDVAQAIVKAVAQTKGPVKADEFIKTLRQVRFDSPRGPLTLDSATQDAIQNYYILQVTKEGGQLGKKVIKVYEPAAR